MKLHGIFFLTAVSILSLFMTGTVFSADNPKLTPEYLASNTWGPFEGSVTIKFTKDGRFDMTDNGVKNCDEREQGSGIYKISGNKITLTFDSFPMTNGVPQCTNYTKGNILQGKLTNENSIKYRWYISFGNPGDNGATVYNYNTLIKEDETLLINKIEAVSTGSKQGTAATVLKVRETPGISGKELNFKCDLSTGDTEQFKSLDKGQNFRIFARTKDKDTVGKYNNYWYYIRFKGGKYCEEIYEGWVFGEFVKLK